MLARSSVQGLGFWRWEALGFIALLFMALVMDSVGGFRLADVRIGVLEAVVAHRGAWLGCGEAD